MFLIIDDKIRLLDSCTSALFKEVLETQVFSELMDYGDAEPPSSLAGFFMKLIGNCILRHVHVLKEKFVLFTQEEAIQVQLLNGGEMLISGKKTVGNGHVFSKFKTNVISYYSSFFSQFFNIGIIIDRP